MMNDIEYRNEYYMNQNMVDKYLKSIELVLNPSYYKYDYYRLEVCRRTIHMLKEFPDNEVLIVNRNHPHCYKT